VLLVIKLDQNILKNVRDERILMLHTNS